MRRKWVILAAVVFLGIVGWVWFRVAGKDGEYSHYVVDVAVEELSVSGVSAGSGAGAISLHAKSSRSSLDRLKYWFECEFLSINIQYVSGFLFEDGKRLIVVDVFGYPKNVQSVEIRPNYWPAPEAEIIRKELTDRFPGLPCRITAPSQ